MEKFIKGFYTVIIDGSWCELSYMGEVFVSGNVSQNTTAEEVLKNYLNVDNSEKLEALQHYILEHDGKTINIQNVAQFCHGVLYINNGKKYIIVEDDCELLQHFDEYVLDNVVASVCPNLLSQITGVHYDVFHHLFGEDKLVLSILEATETRKDLMSCLGETDVIELMGAKNYVKRCGFNIVEL